MRSLGLKMPADYITVKVTPGRISKGLLSIPVSLRDIFPRKRQNISVLFDSSTRIFEKPFSPYESSTRECRIYGLSRWYQRHRAMGGERVVITVVDRASFVYRLCFEDFYLLRASGLEESFLSSKSEKQADAGLRKISEWTGFRKIQVALREFEEIAKDKGYESRRRILERAGLTREKIPHSVKTLIGEVYKGHCQVCDFTFLKKDRRPYFEIHHLERERGHRLKNLLSVCPNCHRQFEYADVRLWHNSQQWLVRVKFNDRVHEVNQILCKKL